MGVREKKARLIQVFGPRMKSSCHLLRRKCLRREQVWATKVEFSLGINKVHIRIRDPSGDVELVVAYPRLQFREGLRWR